MHTQTFTFQMSMRHPSLIEWRQPEKMALLQKPRLRLLNSVENLYDGAGKMCNSFMIRSSAPLTEQREVNQEIEFDDGYYMRRCVDLAKKAIGCTSPNPMVGCIILKDGKIVGEGYHPKAGQPHAEVFALRDAGDAAENGTVYVTLEPCNHYGRTPPCTEALIKAKVRKVVVGMVDPNPIVASKGVKKLQDAGIEVIVGVEEDLCKSLNEAYIHRMLTGKPFVTLRYSMSLDGYRVNNLSEEATEVGGYHSKLLQECDAIILSSKALSSHPSWLMSKEPEANQPQIFVLWDDDQDTESQIPALNSDVASNVTIISKSGSLLDILEECNARGMCSILLDFTVENAEFANIVKEGFDEKLFQRVIVDVLPIIGDHQGRSILKFQDVNAKVKNFRSRSLGKSILLEGYL